MLVTLTHPISGFTGTVTVKETIVLPFTNGTSNIDVDPTAFGAIQSSGILISIGAQAPAPPYDANLDTTVAPLVTNGGSTTAGALRAAFGRVYEASTAVDLARTPRVDLPRPQMPAVTWANTDPTGMSRVYIGNWGANGFALTDPLPVRYINDTPANLQVDTANGGIESGANGPAAPGPLTQEVSVTTDKLVLQLVPLVSGALGLSGCIEVWVDDSPLTIPVTSGPATATSRSAWNLTLTWPSSGVHTVRFGLSLVYCNNFWISSGATSAPTTAPGGPRLLVQGDSWVEGTSTGPITFARLLPRYLGVEDAAIAGQGGTGYTQPGPAGQNRSVYGSTDRVQAIAAANPTDIVVFGSVNDDGASASAVQSAAAAHYAALATALPSANVYVVLPQPAGDSTQDGTAGHLANVAAVKTAAQAATNVKGIVDLSGLLTGTGIYTARLGDGNRDLYIGADHHPTPAGHHFLARHCAVALSQWIYPTL